MMMLGKPSEVADAVQNLMMRCECKGEISMLTHLFAITKFALCSCEIYGCLYTIYIYIYNMYNVY